MLLIKKIIRPILTLALLSLTISACQQQAETKKVIIKPVKSIVVQAPLSYTIRSFPGKVLASKRVQLSFQVPGQIIKLPVLEGMDIKQGDVIAELDPERYQHRVDETEAIFIRSTAEYKRAAGLVKGGYISQSEYDTKRSQYLVSKSNLDTAKRNLRNTKLIAPFTGVIARKYVENYEFIKAKQPIVDLHDITAIDIEVNIPEAIIMYVDKDSDSAPTASFPSAPKQEFKTRFKEIATEADPETQTYRLRLTMPAPKHINVLPGMTVNIKTKLPDHRSGKQFITIPASAVFNAQNNQPSVWIIDPKTMRVKLRTVSVKRLTERDIQITKGLKPGERIVTAGVHDLRDGQQVKLLPPQTEKRP